ncbi:hypothetical protein [uncultured Mediterranean phage]|nr:hypothetical protein [uncultured Mediterranean phage]
MSEEEISIENTQEETTQEETTQEENTQEETNLEVTEIPEEFVKIIKDLMTDILTTFPEYKEKLNETLRKVCCDEGEESDTIELLTYVKGVLPERFFDILYQNNDIFTNKEVNTCFLPDIDFADLWVSDISDNTRVTLWKYLQLLLFSVIGDLSNGESFGDTAKLFEAINEDDFKNKLQETVDEMQKIFDINGEAGEGGEAGKGGEGGEEGEAGGGEEGEGDRPSFKIDKDDLPDPDKIHEHIMGMLDGKLGNLAKEIAAETAQEMSLDMDEGSSVNDVFEKLFKNPGKLMGLVKNVGSKLDQKIKDGNIKESELVEEASEMMNKMKDIPGMKNIQSMLGKMGIPGVGGKNSKVNMNAFQSHMQSTMRQSKMKERMQSKLRKNQEERENQSEQLQQIQEVQQQVQSMLSNTDENNNNIDPSLLTNDWLHMENDKLVFSLGTKSEKTPAKKSKSSKDKNKNRKNKKNKKNKKKNKN